jgi:hypothetical protein
MRILSRSKGETTVRETAPATPPAQKAAITGWEIDSRNCADRSGAVASVELAMSDCDWIVKLAILPRNSDHACDCFEVND